MVHRLLKTGKFQRKLVTVDEHGNTIVSEVDGTLEQLNGKLSFIDSVSVYNRKNVMSLAEKKNIHKPLNKLDAAEISYQRFLFFKNFYSPSKPVIICEGKTDNIYIRAAIRQLVGYYPRLAEQKKDQINLKVKLFQYTHTTKRLLKLGGGEDNLKQFMESFTKNCEKIEASGLQHPVIILIDNDKGADKIYSFLKKATNAKAEIKGVEPYYFIAPNLYVVAIPKDENGADTMIEDFFDQSVRDEKNRGKTFNPEPDVKTEYGESTFAEHIVKKNQNRIDFSGFKPILGRIDAVLIDFQGGCR
jgi:5S rRNA maturation endonuclease (ribonuclease M5)